MQIKWMLCAQAALILIALFVPFGFDKPSSLGLDFDHVIMLAAAYIVLLIFGVMLAIQKRNWRALMAQVLAPCLVVGLTFALR